MKVQNYKEIPVEPVKVEGAEKVSLRWLISQGDGAENFVMRMFELDPGGYFPHHAHGWEHEVFVLEGEGVLVGEGEKLPIRPGDTIFISPNEGHHFENTGRALFRFICLRPV